MSEQQQIKLWDDWDDINLSTPERRIERLEILLCQKVHKGEDISECLQVLEYLKNCTTHQKLESVFFRRVHSKMTFNSWQIIGQATLISLVAISCCFAMYKIATSSIISSNSPSELSLGKQLSKTTPPHGKKHHK
ncbi:MAG: hypothetical protein RM049_11085 [Nostoc sp. DedQUE04]|jgi:hypothetical protein|uniref:hypothetical protein n=1 Tax=Nostoc sp. DedQUE04 TaxID=3075390 RepID=UPI002AD4FD72|nr:hypothetical protein [Nostoc sp. DedQUE04]MBW4426942.1 hypothetical protein [Nostoc desertorum CM1-VF14]MDZ8135829.1 hypothetical protein [Nostoc sp. DedQUE04]